MPARTSKPLPPENNRPQRLTLAIIESLKNKGYSQADIARMFGVTRQAVTWHKKHYGGRLTPRETVLQHWPWDVPVDMGQCSACRRLRDHGEYVATGGVGMSEDKLARLRSFYNKLRDHVVEFDPEIPPEDGVSVAGGFAFRRRHTADGDLLIRVNKHTHLSEEGKRIWRFPPLEP